MGKVGANSRGMPLADGRGSPSINGPLAAEQVTAHSVGAESATSAAGRWGANAAKSLAWNMVAS